MRPILGGLAMAIALTGCASDMRPLPSDPRAVDTGTYPRFSARPTAASAQIGQGEATGSIGRLQTTAARTANGAPRPVNETASLRRLRDTHERDTLARIAAE